MIRRVFALALAAVVSSAWIAAAAAAEGDGEALPKGVVARVLGLTPSQGTITIRELRRTEAQVIAAARYERGDRAPLPSGKALVRKALTELLNAADVQGQARELGIHVDHREIRTELAAIKKQNFESERAYWEFLHQMKYTPRDVHERVELQILGTRIQEWVVRGAGSYAAARKALREFLVAYRQRWHSRTVCAPEYVFGRCSNG